MTYALRRRFRFDLSFVFRYTFTFLLAFAVYTFHLLGTKVHRSFRTVGYPVRYLREDVGSFEGE